MGSFALYPTLSANGSNSDGLIALVTCVFFTVLGLFALVVSLRVGAMLRQAKQTQSATQQRINELNASGQLLPIPPLPLAPRGISADRIAQVERYAKQMAEIPWGGNPQVAPADAPAVFNQTVARVRRIRGDWNKLSEPINIFTSLPKPWCYIGAAEVMHRLSYLQGYAFAPAGLRQGLRFVAESQFFEAMHPDALVIRTVLLAGTTDKNWLALADQTLNLLRKVAPNHLRPTFRSGW